MKDNFFTSMLAEGGKVSHKRWISVTIAAVLAWCIVYTTVKSPELRQDIIHVTMIFILVMSGVATVAQITSLITRQPQKETKKEETTDATGTN